ncbi:MAG: hypothetical protein PVI88_00340 [Nitrosopumilaceae archaeon]|jgi:hypothetical protein
MNCSVVEEMYYGYNNLLHQKVNKYFILTGVDREELQGQANLIFMECVTSFLKIPNRKHSFSTHLCNSLEWEIIRFLEKEEKKRKSEISIVTKIDDAEYYGNEYYIDPLAHDDYCVQTIELNDLINNLNGDLAKECKYILRLILHPTEKQKREFPYKSRKMSRKSIQKYLREKGWKITTIKNCFRKIRQEIINEL